MENSRKRAIAAIVAVSAAVLLVLDNRLDLGAFHDIVDFLSGILIGGAIVLMMLSREREPDE
jgi:uncharacterized membrane protein YgaE (UPF0421/DUF939 family)